MALPADQVADGHIGHRRSDVHDFTGEFVADRDWWVQRPACPGVPALDVQVGAADAGRLDLDKHVTEADFRNRHLCQLEPRSRLGLDERAHSTILPGFEATRASGGARTA
jgi:hypothetical protein